MFCQLVSIADVMQPGRGSSSAPNTLRKQLHTQDGTSSISARTALFVQIINIHTSSRKREFKVVRHHLRSRLSPAIDAKFSGSSSNASYP
ncbi:hypothetical protein HYPSUDRAFT_92157 [Hypholoma sublateritium FD-334 SS-4]|uniref:Uncharacterized protein n=1 Tax=Hypholoma sublateritium (strain FD-334 SS-4) TaxID=945553 RepID=A0A0D2LVL1_HYPSF|nr:hypothetical protein HYPSUDRAFT_92157 [Hypholoma sublateritium FD-334 SS-4]